MKVDNDVLNVLAEADTDGPALRLVGQMDRTLYVKTNKALEAAGGKWNRSSKAHLFPDDAADAIEQMMLTGEIIIAKQEFGFFESPPKVVDRLVKLARLEGGQRVLEPSAGHGNIALRLAAEGCDVDCIELLEANVGTLRSAGLPTVRHADFLACEPDPVYDRVVMNPPFAKQADSQHVLHALTFLSPGGLLVSVMAPGVTFRSDKASTTFRDLVEARGGAIEDLPDGSFKESGTMVRTIIVVIPAGA